MVGRRTRTVVNEWQLPSWRPSVRKSWDEPRVVLECMDCVPGSTNLVDRKRVATLVSVCGRTIPTQHRPPIPLFQVSTFDLPQGESQFCRSESSKRKGESMRISGVRFLVVLLLSAGTVFQAGAQATVGTMTLSSTKPIGTTVPGSG